MNYTLIGLKNAYCILDYILIVSKGSEEDHKKYVLNCLKRLDKENLRIALPKSYLSKLEIDWRGYHLSRSDFSPFESKNLAILTLEAPKSL